MLWICRTSCFWREKLWQGGEGQQTPEVVEISGVHQWVYSGGMWSPQGVEVVTENQLIPRHFEPADWSCLANGSDDIKLARNGKGPDAMWRFPTKDEIEPELVPLDPTPNKPKPRVMTTFEASTNMGRETKRSGRKSKHED